MLSRIFLLLALILSSCHAMHEDEAGKNDWHKPLLGPVVAIGVPLSPKRSNAIALATSDGTIALVNEKTGDLLWRRLFGADVVFVSVTLVEKRVAVLAAGGTLYILEASDGSLLTSQRVPKAYTTLSSRDDRIFLISEGGEVMTTDVKEVVEGNVGEAKVEKSPEGWVSSGRVVASGSLACTVGANEMVCIAIKEGGNKVVRKTGTIAAIEDVADNIVVVRLTSGAIQSLAWSSKTSEFTESEEQRAVVSGAVLTKCYARGCVWVTADGNVHGGDAQGKVVVWTRDDGLALFHAALMVAPKEQISAVNERVVVIVATTRGKVYAMRSEDGAVIWQQTVSEPNANIRLMKAGGSGTEDFFVVVTKETGPTTTEVTRYNAVTGSVTAVTVSTRGEAAHVYVDNLGKGVVIVMKDGSVVGKSPGSDHSYAVRGNAVFGYRGGSVSWVFRLANNDTVEAVSDHADPSSFLYADTFRIVKGKMKNAVFIKQSMANLVTVAALNAASHTLSIYFLDGVTGSVVGTLTHEDAARPVSLAVAEHFATYHYVHATKLIPILGVAELLHPTESLHDATYTTPAMVATSFTLGSSANVPLLQSHLPQLHNSLFYIPSIVSALDITRSARGLTPKHVAVATIQGRIVLIDMRILFGAGGDRTDIPLPPTQYLSHKNVVQGVRKVLTSVATMESCTHVMAAGKDVFYARTYPVKGYDILNDDVNYDLLMGLLAASVVATGLLRYLAKKKQQKASWA